MTIYWRQTETGKKSNKFELQLIQAQMTVENKK